jgi:hypothetical protein
MIHLARRHFFNEMNTKHFKKRSKKMGGPLNLDSTAWVAKDTVQESIDSLNAAIDRLDAIIREMDENCKH